MSLGSSFDEKIRILRMMSCLMLKNVRGHQSLLRNVWSEALICLTKACSLQLPILKAGIEVQNRVQFDSLQHGIRSGLREWVN